MPKISFLVRGMMILLLLLVLITPAMAERMVLMELFTSTTCNPCRPANGWLNDWYPDHYDEVAIIRYHVWWPAPGNDPFYLANPDESRIRTTYYGVTGVPNMRIDGIIDGGSNYPWDGIVESRLQIPNRVDIAVDGLYDWTTGEGSVTIDVTAIEEFTYDDLRLFVVVVENDIHYIGPNQDPVHDQVMRDMIPNAEGEPFEITYNETVSFDFDFVIDDEWEAENCEIVVFVQDVTTRNVHQAFHTSLDSLFPIWVSYEASGTDAILPSSEEAFFYSMVQNQGDVDYTFDVFLTSSIPDGWDCTFMIGEDVYEESAELLLPAGEIGLIIVNFNPQNIAGEGHAEIEIIAQEDPRVHKYLDFHLITSDVAFLIVDDAADAEATIYQELLAETGFPYGTWDIAVDGLINNDDILPISTILWFTGGDQEGALVADQSVLTDYLDNGGKLLLSGKNLNEVLGQTDFYTQYLAAQTRFNDFAETMINGVEGDPIGEGMIFIIDQSSPDVILPNTEIEDVYPVFRYGGHDLYASLRHETDTYQTVFYSIDLEGIVDADDRDEVILRSLDWLNGGEVSVESSTIEVNVSQNYQLSQNIPNPFNPQTMIQYALPQKSSVKLRIYSTSGQLIKTLVDKSQPKGHYKVMWDGSDETGQAVPSGIYFYQLSADETNFIRQMVLLR